MEYLWSRWHKIESALSDIQQINTPADEIINEISIKNENQQLFDNSIQTYDVWLTRAIIFHTNSRDICFKKDFTAFSEDIKIIRGHDLIKTYLKENKYFLEDWDDGVVAKCRQEIIALK